MAHLEEDKKDPEPPKKVETADASVQTHNSMNYKGVLAKEWILDDKGILRERGQLQPDDRVMKVNDSRDSHLNFVFPNKIYTAWGREIALEFFKGMGVILPESLDGKEIMEAIEAHIKKRDEDKEEMQKLLNTEDDCHEGAIQESVQE